jgi:uncharacterized ion transporter superfamily protein YfcC
MNGWIFFAAFLVLMWGVWKADWFKIAVAAIFMIMAVKSK